ncbi:hypothetical protein BC830DRAFT_1116033 [Chytriomyces sp. MP71]|nr:hypothetical protein BC830DRAFT_1116033 [Chytriomyces sp. MP71]
MSAQTAHVARQLESLRNESRGAQADLAAAVVGLETQARDVQARLGECVEGVKVLQGRFDFQLVAMENLRNHVARGSTGGGGESGNDGKRVVEIASGLVDSSVKAAVAVETSTLRRAVGAKVDTAVLEELIRHLATRDELRRMYEKLQSTIGRSVKAREEEDEVVTERLQTRVMADLKRDVEVRVTNLKLEVKEMLKSNRAGMSGREGSHVSPAKESSGTSVSATELQDALNVLEHRWGQQLDRTLSQVGSNGFKIPDSLIEELREDLMDHVNLALNQHALDATGATVGTATAIGANKPIQSMLSAITREFDEKLYLLCTDLSACKTAYQAAARQPFYRCAQWLWTSGTLKLGSAVPWNLQTHNTDPENFIWESASHVIRILEPGLYEISFAFFDITWKPSVQVVVNGESVMSALNAPSYVVHHSSGFVRSGDGNVRPGTVTGLSLIDFMSLPAKSTVAIHYHGSKKEVVGHAFLGLRRL